MKRVQKGKFFSPHSNGEYIKMGPNDIGKLSIPKSERCEGFDELWNQVYNEVMLYWEFVPVTSIHEFDQYQKVEEE